MSRILCSRFVPPTALAIVACILAAAPAAGLEVTVEEWDGPAFPTGAPATANVTVSYNCGDLLPPPAGADIQIETSLEEGAQGSISQDADSFTPPTPVVDCVPEDDPITQTFNLTYTATEQQLAGTTESITVRAEHNTTEETADSGEDTTSATVGPYVDVTFTALNETFEVTAGESASVEIEVTSGSNTGITPNPTLEVPEGWEVPEVTAPTVASPLEAGADGTETLTAEVTVPEDTEEGEYTVTFSAFARSETDPPVATDTVEIPLTFQVSPMETEEEEGPGPALLPIVLSLIVAVVVARRRRA